MLVTAYLCAKSAYKCEKERSVLGLAQFGVTASLFLYIYNLGQKTTAVVHQTALLAFTSGHVVAAGIKDISQRSFVKGSCKFLLGASGLAYSAYHLYSYLYPEKKIRDAIFLK